LLLVAFANCRVNAQEVRDLIERLEPNVVCIKTDRGLGSGIVLDDLGTVATNFHVISGTTQATATFADQSKVKVLGYLAVEPGRDLAVLRLDVLKRRPTRVPLARGLPRKGDRVLTFGSPQGFEFSTSEGIVSAIRVGREIRDTMRSLHGGDPYGEHGYDLEATWIQTTAAISGGNSGGALVNLAGEVVGLNTWTYTRGQNLNFAIAAPDIQRILDKAPREYRELSTLPKRADMTVRTLDGTKIVFPSGKVLNESVFKVSIEATIDSVLNSPSVAILSHANGSRYAVASHRNGVLDGPAVVQYETEDPAVYATYAGGKRHGIVKTWDPQGRKVYFCQYLKGKRNGFCCLFENEQLQLVAECRHDNLEHIHLMDDERVLNSFAGHKEALKNEVAKKQLARLSDVELQMKKNEREFKKQIAADDARLRRERVSVLNPQKRARGQARISERRARSNSVIQGVQRNAAGQ